VKRITENLAYGLMFAVLFIPYLIIIMLADPKEKEE
jgi:hypothetical protein